MEEKFYSAFCKLLYKNFGDKWDFKYDEESFEDGDAFTLNLTVWGLPKRETDPDDHARHNQSLKDIERGK